MKCPHCRVEVNASFNQVNIGIEDEVWWYAHSMNCPNSSCGKLIVELSSKNPAIAGAKKAQDRSRFLVKPFSSNRPPAPTEVDDIFAEDYREACLVLTFSPKASAALSRRCLQNILREKAKVKKNDLAKEIQEVIDSNSLPSYLSESIDAIRNIGNYAAHPVKSTSSGEIVKVEEGEAEWLLDVLESLFDFYFVQPAVLQTKRNALNIKLKEAGKPSMK